jgi:endonuclease YncB( thermonuclease family)
MDKYNRLVAVAYVEYNSTHLMNVNKWLLVNGYAKTYDYPNEFNPPTGAYTLKHSLNLISHHLTGAA